MFCAFSRSGQRPKSGVCRSSSMTFPLLSETVSFHSPRMSAQESPEPLASPVHSQNKTEPKIIAQTLGAPLPSARSSLLSSQRATLKAPFPQARPPAKPEQSIQNLLGFTYSQQIFIASQTESCLRAFALATSSAWKAYLLNPALTVFTHF